MRLKCDGGVEEVGAAVFSTFYVLIYIYNCDASIKRIYMVHTTLMKIVLPIVNVINSECYTQTFKILFDLCRAVLMRKLHIVANTLFV